MVNTDESQGTMQDISLQARKLGWLSSYARQILLARHVLRILPAVDDEELIVPLLRLAISALSFHSTHRLSTFAPYTPSDRPEHFSLKAKHASEWEVEVSISLKDSDLSTISFSNNYVRTKLVLSGTRQSFMLLAHETQSVGRGVSLFNKKVADARCDSLKNDAIWRTLPRKARVPLLEEEFLAGEDFTFWRKWYAAFLEGRPLDWELQRRIAQIDGRFWNSQGSLLRNEVDLVCSDFLTERVPLAEDVKLNPDTGKFFSVPVTVENPTLLSATLGQVSDALDDVLIDISNGINDRSNEVRVLRRTLNRYGNDPQRVEMDFTAIHSAIVRQIAVGELPPSEENLALQRALIEGAQAVRATHPEVAKNRSVLAVQAIVELNEIQKETLQSALPLLVDITEGAMRDDFLSDVPELLNSPFQIEGSGKLGTFERNAVLADYAEKARTIGRIAPISVILRRYPGLLTRIERSSAYRTAGIMGTLSALIGIFLSLIGAF